MDMFKFDDVRIEKANAISRYRRLERIATLFRFVELCFFLIIVSKFSNQFPFSLKSSGEYVRGISVTLISPRFVFVVGNVIILVLFLKSGEFSTKNGEKPADLYEEYVKKCRRNQEKCVAEEKIAASDHGYKYGVCSDERKIHRSCSDQNLVKAVAHGQQLRRSMTEKCRNYRGGSSKAEDDMNGEEFRRTVEAFIARQQRYLREEDKNFHWQKPPYTCLKFHVDATIFKESGVVGFGAIICDSCGQFMVCRMCNRSGLLDIGEAEVLALLDASSWADTLELEEVIFETDSTAVVIVNSVDSNVMDLT